MRHGRSLPLIAIVALGCGRLGFDRLPPDGGGFDLTEGDGGTAQGGGDDGGPPPDAARATDADVAPSACEELLPDGAIGPIAVDKTCDGRDDDCDDAVDEDYANPATSCGIGACARAGRQTCVNGRAVDSCTPGSPVSLTDDIFAPGNGIDDDCDGNLDEDVPSCAGTAPLIFEVGSAPRISVPPGCGYVTVRLWGGGGAAGESVGVTIVHGGPGGAGGYAASTFAVTGPLDVFVGRGGPGCERVGTNDGSAAFDGGEGEHDEGAPGGDGVVAGGGAGGVPSTGYPGGNGHFGGGGGGEGRGGLGASGEGGGGGAATVLLMSGSPTVIAGGGGGGGGAQAASLLGTLTAPGSAGGAGCSSAGRGESLGGGGGGGGLCLGLTRTSSSSPTPGSTNGLPSGRAVGGANACAPGGNGYAVVTFSQ